MLRAQVTPVIFESSVWGHQNAALRAGFMIFPPTVGPLWGSEMQPEITENRASRAGFRSFPPTVAPLSTSEVPPE